MKKCGKKVLAMVLSLGMLWGGGQAAQVPESEQLQQLTGIQAPGQRHQGDDHAFGDGGLGEWSDHPG